MTIREALEILHSGQWISLRCLTAYLAKGTGGKIIELSKCRIYGKKPVDLPGSVEQETSRPSNSKAQNHHANFTRNVQMQNGQIIKVHPILITHINNTQLL